MVDCILAICTWRILLPPRPCPISEAPFPAKVMCVLCIGQGHGTLELQAYDEPNGKPFKVNSSPGTARKPRKRTDKETRWVGRGVQFWCSLSSPSESTWFPFGCYDSRPQFLWHTHAHYIWAQYRPWAWCPWSTKGVNTSAMHHSYVSWEMHSRAATCLLVFVLFYGKCN